MSIAESLTSGELRISEVTDAQLWSSSLLSFADAAHPLQTWEWGEAKRSTGERVHRSMVSQGDRPLLLAQVFEKKVTPLRLRVAWVPRGPVLAEGESGMHAFRLWKKAMARRGYRFCVFQPYRAASPLTSHLGRVIPVQREFTFMLDLSRPLESIEQSLDKEWRYGKNRFTRDGGRVFEDSGSSSVPTLELLISMLTDLAHRKNFEQYGDAELLRSVYRCFSASSDRAVSAHLFRAVVGDKTAGCALILRVGDIAHYNWGAFDYELRNLRVNEGLQWAIIERLRAMNVRYYDLEGADLKRNPGVFHFKRKMGGRLIEHPPYQLSISL